MDVVITGKTKSIWLLGNPVEHSISPQIQNHAIVKLGLPYVYTPISITTENLSHALKMIRSDSLAGANVTIPHKRSAVDFCDEISEISQYTGTVNTIYKRDGRVCGTTTDPGGFFRALHLSGHELGEDNTVIIGNGGTAETLASAMALEKAFRTLTITGRSSRKIERLAESISRKAGVKIEAVCLSDAYLEQVMHNCTLLINCTSVGMYPDIDRSPVKKEYFHPAMTVFDCIYNPAKTLFLQHAQVAGCKIINGLGMLLYQGLASFKLWTGVSVPEEYFQLETLQKLVSKE